MKKIAFTFTANSTSTFHPTFERGDTATQMFAESSSKALSLDGVSLAVSEFPNPEAILEAIRTLESFLEA